MTAFDPLLDRAADDRYATWDAAYVLGSLSSEERREYEAHLKTCAHCRSAVAELSGIPALLSKVGPADFREFDSAPAEPPAEVLPGLLDKVRARRRRSRWMATAAVGLAAAVLAVGIAIVMRPETFGVQTGTPPQASGQQLEMNKVSETPINATISMTGYGWGTRIDMACTYGDWGQRDAPPQDLAMVVVGNDGTRNQIATWLGLSGATALPSANTPMQMDEIAAVQLVSSESGEVLLERSL
ncbi:anti-sigma factor [Mycolicibacterium celeriflavum]|uniref:Anti-sigma factor n=1 Tax=Mycolicibacterium celeriflavum TaxID=1249101 RepID=A0A1X0BYF0_MYCCF|nr:zf-HC2 domain-containing protein [Mycolicibacterium celeriflavum]MCV7236778.1 zf-HC2 domain-containing protein [Mycolicibacterium celeriflavum]OBG20151.1 anti-sigma factor [Mycolicibacterium celeriflavum]ORA49570.1 anti-sigma factor [Mycolicibacterium celeriflavum]BBY43976.1 anti-sigma factor [Mycolicibacterium celeriflavum]